jgi:hypothetical protein
MSLKKIIQQNNESGQIVSATEPENAKFVASPRQFAKSKRSRVQFDTAPAKVIPQSLSMAKNEKRADWQTLDDPPVTDTFSQRSRLIKLVLTLALPTVVVFAQVQPVGISSRTLSR